jgi:hypothetical protein
MDSGITYSRNGLAARAFRARQIALEIAGGRAALIRPLADGSVLIVNYAGFDTSAWRQPERRTKARKAGKK